MTYRPGIENVPSRKSLYDQPLPILVIIRDLKDYRKVDEKRLDFSKPDDRKFIGKLTYWAITNNHSIETISMSDAEAPTVPR